MGWKRFWKGYDWLARADFASTLSGGLFDWRGWAFAVGGSVVTFLWAAVREWDPFLVWIATVGVGAGIAIIYIASRFSRNLWPDHAAEPVRRVEASSDISISLESDATRIGDYKTVCSIIVTNAGVQELDRCQVQITKLSGVRPDGMHLPFTLRTIDQIEGNESGRFILSKGQTATIPILFFLPQRKTEWFFFDENKKSFFVPANPIELSIRIYGGREPLETPLFIQTDAGSNPFPVLTAAPRLPLATAIHLEPVLEIIFDPQNPGRKFWSIEPMRDENGSPKVGSFWEYRALIRNRSNKTVRNVKVVVEAVGPMPTRPEPSQFDINKQHLMDLTPGEEQLVLIRRWYNPPIVAGMVCGGAYGPVKMTVMADDVFPATKLFQFDPERTPMIWELNSDA